MSAQSKNKNLWYKLYVIHGIEGLNKITGVDRETLRSLCNPDKEEIPSPSVQRKLERTLQYKIEEMFPFTFAQAA